MTRKIAFLPLRGGSKGIPGKNIRPLAGRPLAYWVLDAASTCDEIDCVYVATDDDAIADTIRRYPSGKVEVISRSAESATDTASTEFAMLEFARSHEAETIILLQATSPLLEAQHLSEAISLMKELRADSLLSVVPQKRFAWQDSQGLGTPVNYIPARRPRRQEFAGMLIENGAFYITSREALLASECRISGRIGLYRMPESTYVELDEREDWEIIERLLEMRLTKTSKSQRSVKLFATDVDGVLTDGGMYYGSNGEELKKFNTRDGMGMRLLQESGVLVGIITSEETAIVLNRAKKLKLDFVFQAVRDKLTCLKDLCLERGISLNEVAYIGDDLNDLDCIRAAGISACPSDSTRAIKKLATICLASKGGEGAVREFCEQLLAIRRVETR